MEDPNMNETTVADMIELDVAEEEDLLKDDIVSTDARQNCSIPKDKDQQTPVSKKSETDKSSVENSPCNTNNTKTKKRRKWCNISSAEDYWDEKDLEHLRKPFQSGWKREIVYRSNNNTSDRILADVYYFSPTGKKLRSLIEISSYLGLNDLKELNLTHFTFKKRKIYRPPDEIERKASQRLDKTPGADQNTTASKSIKTNSAKKQTKSSDSINTSTACKVREASDGSKISTPVTTSASSRPCEYFDSRQKNLSRRNIVYSHSLRAERLKFVQPVTTSSETSLEKSTAVESREEENQLKPSNTQTPIPKSSSKETAAQIKLKKAKGKALEDFQNIFGKPSNLIASIVSQAHSKRPAENDIEKLGGPECKVKRTETSNVNGAPPVATIQLHPGGSKTDVLNTCGASCLGTSPFQFCADCKNIHHSLCSLLLGLDKTGLTCIKCASKTKLNSVSKANSEIKIMLGPPAATISSDSSQTVTLSPAFHMGQTVLTNCLIPRPPPLLRADQFKILQPFTHNSHGLPPPPRLQLAGRLNKSLTMPGLTLTPPQAGNKTLVVTGPSLYIQTSHPQAPLKQSKPIVVPTKPSIKLSQAGVAITSGVQNNENLVNDEHSPSLLPVSSCENDASIVPEKTISNHADDDIDTILPISFEKSTDNGPSTSCNTGLSKGDVDLPTANSDAHVEISSDDDEFHATNVLNNLAVEKETDKSDVHEITTLKSFVPVTRSHRSYVRLMHCFSFTVMMNIFRHLKIPDLLRLCLVCKKWKDLAWQPCLWRNVFLNNVRIKSWKGAAAFFNKVKVYNLNMENVVSLENSWDVIIQAVPEIKTLEHLTFHKVPANVLDTITQMMPNLVNISTWAIIGDQEILPDAKSLDQWSDAVTKVKSGQLSVACAAALYNISEKDLSQLLEPKFTYQLHDADSNCILVTCMRLMKMGFKIQLSNVVQKALELMSKKYKEGLNTLLLKQCNDLFMKNQPLLQPDIASSTDIKFRLESHYFTLRRLQETLNKKLLAPSQVLVLDSKVFSISIKGVSVNITGLSLMSPCPKNGVYPMMLICSHMIGLTHPYIIMAQGKDGLANSQLVSVYIARLVKQEFRRPKIIVCNSSPDLFNDLCVSYCIHSAVYLHCVQQDLAKYVFPGCLGGPLFRTKTFVDQKSSLSLEQFLEFIINHFQSKLEVANDILQAFTASGLYPFNPKAPYEHNTDLSASVEKTSLAETNDTPLEPPNQTAKKEQYMEIASRLNAPISNISKSLNDISLSLDQPKKITKESPFDLVKMKENKSIKSRRRIKQLKSGKHKQSSSDESENKQSESNQNAALNVTEKSGLSDKVGMLGISGNRILGLGNVHIEEGSVVQKKKKKESIKRAKVRPESAKLCALADKNKKDSKVISSGKAKDSSEISLAKHRELSEASGKCAISAYKGNKKLFIHNYLQNVNLKQRMKKAQEQVKIACFRLRQRTLLDLTETLVNSTSYVPFQKEESLYKGKKKKTECISHKHGETVNSGIAKSRVEEKSYIPATVISSRGINQVPLQTDQSRNVLNVSSRIPDKCSDKEKTSDTVVDERRRNKDIIVTKSPTKARRKSKSSEKKRHHRRKDSDNDIPDKSFDILVKKHIPDDGAKVVTEVIQNDFSELTGSNFVQQVTLVDHDYFKKSFDTEGEINGETGSPGGKPLAGSRSPISGGALRPLTRCLSGKLPTTKKGKDTASSESSPDSSSNSSTDSVNSDSSEAENSETTSDSDWTESKPGGLFRNRRKKKKKNQSKSSGSSGSKPKETQKNKRRKKTNNSESSDSSESEHEIKPRNKIGNEKNDSSEDSDSASDAILNSEQETGAEEIGEGGEEETSEEEEEETSGEEDEDSSEDDTTESKCQICLKANPPDYKGEVIDWVDCDGNCQRWFHIVCIQRTNPTADIEHYMCTACIETS